MIGRCSVSFGDNRANNLPLHARLEDSSAGIQQRKCSNQSYTSRSDSILVNFQLWPSNNKPLWSTGSMHSEYQQMYTVMETAHTYGGPCKCQTAQPPACLKFSALARMIARIIVSSLHPKIDAQCIRHWTHRLLVPLQEAFLYYTSVTSGKLHRMLELLAASTNCRLRQQVICSGNVPMR